MQKEGNSEELSVPDVLEDPQVDAFLLTALKNPKDRLTILKLEDEFQRFIKDKRSTSLLQISLNFVCLVVSTTSCQ
jgi:hypothetical protein